MMSAPLQYDFRAVLMLAIDTNLHNVCEIAQTFTEGIDCIFELTQTQTQKPRIYALICKYTHILYKQLQTPYRLSCTVLNTEIPQDYQRFMFPEEVMTVTTPPPCTIEIPSVDLCWALREKLVDPPWGLSGPLSLCPVPVVSSIPQGILEGTDRREVNRCTGI